MFFGFFSFVNGYVLKRNWEKHVLKSIFGRNFSKDAVELFKERISYKGLYNLFETISAQKDELISQKEKIYLLEEQLKK